MENRFLDIYTLEELEFMYNMTRRKIGNITNQNIKEYERLEMYLEFNESIKHRTCSCNWKGLFNKLNGLIEEFKDEIAQAYEIKSKPKKGRKKNEIKETKEQ